STSMPSFVIEKNEEDVKRLEERIRRKEKRLERLKSRREKERVKKALERLVMRHAGFFRRHQAEDHHRVKRSEYRLVEKVGTKRDKHSFVRQMDRAPSLLSPQLTPIQTISKAVLKVFKG
ncbi:hypothetical protein PMAYCL1PPCAC_07023, partial [Pristionchus mayeri]